MFPRCLQPLLPNPPGMSMEVVGRKWPASFFVAPLRLRQSEVMLPCRRAAIRGVGGGQGLCVCSQTLVLG